MLVHLFASANLTPVEDFVEYLQNNLEKSRLKLDQLQLKQH